MIVLTYRVLKRTTWNGVLLLWKAGTRLGSKLVACRPMMGLMTHVMSHDFVLTYRVLNGELLGLGLDWQ